MRYERLWLRDWRAPGVPRAPSWVKHVARKGDLRRRVESVRARVSLLSEIVWSSAAILRHGPGMRSSHARLRVPASAAGDCGDSARDRQATVTVSQPYG